MRPVDIFFGLLVAVLWGGNFVAAKIGLGYFPPFFLTFLRFSSVAALLVFFVPKPTREQFRFIFYISMLNTMHFSLPYVGMSMGLNIASTAITAQLGVPFSCILGAMFLNDRLGLWRSLGLAIAFGGMFVVFGAPNILDHRAAFFITLIGAMFWASANIMMKFAKGVAPMQMMAWMSLLSAPQLFAIALVFEPHAIDLIAGTPPAAMLAVSYSIIASTLVAHGLWYHLLKNNPVSQVAPYALPTPVIGSLFGLLWFNEVLTWHVIVGGLVTLIGVAIIVMRRPKLILAEPEPV